MEFIASPTHIEDNKLDVGDVIAVDVVENDSLIRLRFGIARRCLICFKDQVVTCGN